MQTRIPVKTSNVVVESVSSHRRLPSLSANATPLIEDRTAGKVAILQEVISGKIKPCPLNVLSIL